MTSPLDLSSPGGFAPRKRPRTEMRRSESVSPKPKPTARPTTPPPVRCPSLCGHMPCGDGQAVNRWTIEDVVNYVSSIDICAEYAQVSDSVFFHTRVAVFRSEKLLETSLFALEQVRSARIFAIIEAHDKMRRLFLLQISQARRFHARESFRKTNLTRKKLTR